LRNEEKKVVVLASAGLKKPTSVDQKSVDQKSVDLKSVEPSSMKVAGRKDVKLTPVTNEWNNVEMTKLSVDLSRIVDANRKEATSVVMSEGEKNVNLRNVEMIAVDSMSDPAIKLNVVSMSVAILNKSIVSSPKIEWTTE
jgi:type II secretory pathway component PulC